MKREFYNLDQFGRIALLFIPFYIIFIFILFFIILYIAIEIEV